MFVSSVVQVIDKLTTMLNNMRKLVMYTFLIHDVSRINPSSGEDS